MVTPGKILHVELSDHLVHDFFLALEERPDGALRGHAVIGEYQPIAITGSYDSKNGKPAYSITIPKHSALFPAGAHLNITGVVGGYTAGTKTGPLTVIR